MGCDSQFDTYGPGEVVEETKYYRGKQFQPEVSQGVCVRPASAMVGEKALKDSGARETFSTGAQRDRQPGKGKPSLVPNWVIWLVSRVYEDGAEKYSSRNWEKGMPLSNYIDSAERHLAKLKAGMRDEPHATQIIWNMIGYIYTAVLIKMRLRSDSLNDMPNQLSELNEGGVPKAEPLSDYEYKSIASFFDTKF